MTKEGRKLIKNAAIVGFELVIKEKLSLIVESYIEHRTFGHYEVKSELQWCLRALDIIEELG